MVFPRADKTIEHDEKFLLVWKAADSGIADVDDAKAMLTRLKEEYAIQVFIPNPFYVFS